MVGALVGVCSSPNALARVCTLVWPPQGGDGKPCPLVWVPWALIGVAWTLIGPSWALAGVPPTRHMGTPALRGVSWVLLGIPQALVGMVTKVGSHPRILTWVDDH